MQLFEIHPTQQKWLTSKDWKSPFEIHRWLKSKGFRVIGEGAFSSAYEKPGSNKIVKISRESDMCWVDFAKFVQSNPVLVLPRIFEIKQYTRQTKLWKGEPLFIAVMEKLEPISTDKINWVNRSPDLVNWLIVNEVIEHPSGQVIEHVAKYLGIPPEEYFEPTGFGFHNPTTKVTEVAYKWEKSSNNPYAVVFRKIKSTFSKHCYPDIHSGNIMYRQSTRTLIFLDPIAYAGTM